MIRVNPYFLHTSLEPLSGLADDDEAVTQFRDLDPNNEQEVRSLIRRMILPHLLTLSPRNLERIKLAYQYYLSKTESNFERVFYSVLPPFDAPDEPRNFFLWVWKEWFPTEDFQINFLDRFDEQADLNETMLP
jgi:hypothetical protein